MATLSHEHLRKLQADLNASIDGYIDASSNDASNHGRLDELQRGIQDITSKIKAETAPTTSQVLELGWGPAICLAVRVAIDLDVFKLIPDHGIELDELVQKTGAGRNVILRILRMLAASNVINETSQETYAATKLSKAMRAKEARDYLKMSFDSMHPILLSAPAFWRKNGFQDQTQTSNACLDLHKANFFEYLSQDTERMATFQSAMAIQASLPSGSIPHCPFEESFDGIAPDTVHIVDVGGGRGFFLRELLEKYPDIPGRLVLQEYPSVIEDAKTSSLPPRIELRPHDATHPQPISGAKYYYFRRVFHTWPDHIAIQALKALRPAMKKNFSRLLIQDEVIPDVGCDKQKAVQDLNMVIVAAMERSEGQSRGLLREGGFNVRRILRAEVGCLGILEAEPVED